MGANAYVSPGVFTRLQDQTLYVANVSTTTLGIVGTANQGPINERVLITSVPEFTAIFGAPTPDHLAMYAALQYLRFGTRLWFVRVNGTGAERAQAATINGQVRAASLLGTRRGPFAVTDAYGAGTLGTNVAATLTVNSSNQNLFVSVNGGPSTVVQLPTGVAQAKAALVAALNTALTPLGAGAVAGNAFKDGSGNALAVGVITAEVGALQTLTLLPTANSAYSLLGLSAGTYRGNDSNRDWKLVSLDAQGANTTLTGSLSGSSLTTDQAVTAFNAALTSGTFPATAYNVNGAIQFVHSSASQRFSLEWDQPSIDPTVAGVGPTIGLAYGVVSAGRGLSPAAETMQVFASSQGLWGNHLSIACLAGSAADSFQIQVFLNGSLVETWDRLVAKPAQVVGALGTRYFAQVINDEKRGSRYLTVTDIPTNSGYPVFGSYSFSGGDDGLESLTEADYIGTTDGRTSTGLQLFADPEQVDVNLLIVPGVFSAALEQAITSLCETRADCFFLLDPPFGLTTQGVVDWHNGSGVYNDHSAFDTYYGALYHSWVQIYDAYSGQFLWQPPSGVVAAAYAFSDQEGEPWFAPAGLNRALLGTVNRFEVNPNLGARNFMYSGGNAVNPLVSFPVDGAAVWGQRTLQRRPSKTDRVGIVRLILIVRKAVASTLRYLVFEPNDARTWRRFSATLGPFFNGLVAREALRAFELICDATTNTADYTNNNQMHGVITLDAIGAAEEIVVDLVLVPEGATFKDLQF